MSENQKELLRFQMELARWDKHIEHAEKMKEAIHRRIDEFMEKVEAENVVV